MTALLGAAERLRADVTRLPFSPPVAYVYNPLEYAWEGYRQYVERYGGGIGRAVWLGMNPGPFGMAQTGVPFGEVALVRDWLGISAPIGRPAREHPRRPVQGFACPRSEVSGRRLWGWARDHFETPQRFFAHHFVLNYCPLLFLEESGRNLTPDKLPRAEREALQELCDGWLSEALNILQPAHLIAVGGFSEACLGRVMEGRPAPLPLLRIPHPSPANPAANSGWDAAVDRLLVRSRLRIK